MQVRTLGRGHSHRGARRRGADGSATWQLRCPPTRPTSHCFDRQVRNRTRAYGSPKLTCAVELGRNPGTRCASHSRRRRRGGGMRVSWPDFCAASTALPAAPRAGFPPLIPTFTPTRFHEEPEMIVGQHERPPAAVAPSVGPVPVTKVPDSDAGPLEPTAENEMALPVPRCYGAVDSPHRGAGSGGVLA